MTASIVNIAGAGRAPPPRWGALVALNPVFLSPEASAELVQFWGEDEHAGPAERLLAWAPALEALAAEFRGRAIDLGGDAAAVPNGGLTALRSVEVFLVDELRCRIRSLATQWNGDEPIRASVEPNDEPFVAAAEQALAIVRAALQQKGEAS